MQVLTINGGSSSIKFALFAVDQLRSPLLSGNIERIGLPGARFVLKQPRKDSETWTIEARDHRTAGIIFIDWLEKQVGVAKIAGIGHRVVHGGPRFSEPQRITPSLLDELQRLKPFDPEHLPSEVQLIELFSKRFSAVPGIACFDTAFHHQMPRVARLLPLPRRFDSKGVQRYGFHGLSYAYLMEELSRLGGHQAALGRVVLAHLGNGASLAAVRDGKSIDTSMSFTPTAGVPMSTRSGDLDPGVVWYLEQTEQISAKQFHHLVNHESGLLGVSETSPDMRDLLARQSSDFRAAEAVALFCYQIKKWIGAFAAALGGLETLVFAGGIGENAPEIRERICEGLEFLGIEIDKTRNDTNGPTISADSASAAVHVIRTNEEVMIAQSVVSVLGLQNKS